MYTYAIWRLHSMATIKLKKEGPSSRKLISTQTVSRWLSDNSVFSCSLFLICQKQQRCGLDAEFYSVPYLASRWYFSFLGIKFYYIRINLIEKQGYMFDMCISGNASGNEIRKYFQDLRWVSKSIDVGTKSLIGTINYRIRPSMKFHQC